MGKYKYEAEEILEEYANAYSEADVDRLANKIEDIVKAALENGQFVKLPNGVVLSDYDKEEIKKFTYEEIKFCKGQKVYKVYDTVLHIYNRKPVKPNYKLVEGFVRDIYHKYDEYRNQSRVTVEIRLDEKGTHQVFNQSDIFTDKEEAKARLKELQEKE